MWVLTYMGLWLIVFGHDHVACELARTSYYQQTGRWAFCLQEMRLSDHRRHHRTFDESVTYYHRHTHIEE